MILYLDLKFIVLQHAVIQQHSVNGSAIQGHLKVLGGNESSKKDPIS